MSDGLEELRRVLSLGEVMRLIESTARWVDPSTFEYLPIWYPEYARRSHFYKSNWSEAQMNKNRKTGESVHKLEGNIHASKALTLALGLRSDDRPNWSCCHIWGIDDAAFQQSNAVVQDHKYFSCVGNMVLLPTPLKAFTDVMLEVKMMLRVCAANLYGWVCDHESVQSAVASVKDWSKWESYPKSWPTPDRARNPIGTLPFSPRVKSAADRRKDTIRKDIAKAGKFYPREQAMAALQYWKVEL